MTNETSIYKIHVVKFVLFLTSLLIIYNIIDRMFGGGNFMSISVPRLVTENKNLYTFGHLLKFKSNDQNCWQTE